MNSEHVISALMTEYNRTPMVGHIEFEVAARQRALWAVALRLGVSDALWEALERDIPGRRMPEATE